MGKEFDSDDFVAQFLREQSPDAADSPAAAENADSPILSIPQMLLEQNVIEALRGIYDPEIPINIYDLGLIYNVDIDDDAKVHIDMTLTSPGCPVAQTFPGTVECAVKCVDGVSDAVVELVWDPPWTKDMMSEEALLSLGLF